MIICFKSLLILNYGFGHHFLVENGVMTLRKLAILCVLMHFVWNGLEWWWELWQQPNFLQQRPGRWPGILDWPTFTRRSRNPQGWSLFQPAHTHTFVPSWPDDWTTTQFLALKREGIFLETLMISSLKITILAIFEGLFFYETHQKNL